MTEPVFTFDANGDMYVFKSLTAAEQWMEAVDVEAGEYVATYLTDGGHYLPTVQGERVRLMPAGDADASDLRRRLGDYQQRVPSAPETHDPAAFAAEWLRWEDERRWSTRLRRLLQRGK